MSHDFYVKFTQIMILVFNKWICTNGKIRIIFYYCWISIKIDRNNYDDTNCNYIL